MLSFYVCLCSFDARHTRCVGMHLCVICSVVLKIQTCSCGCFMERECIVYRSIFVAIPTFVLFHVSTQTFHARLGAGAGNPIRPREQRQRINRIHVGAGVSGRQRSVDRFPERPGAQASFGFFPVLHLQVRQGCANHHYELFLEIGKICVVLCVFLFCA
jgi:hypothetical protein